MADKTYPELNSATDVQPTDLLASYRPSTSGPLKSITWAILLTAIQTALGAVFLQKANNLSDVANAPQARSNLGLGGSAILAVGQITGTVAAGDDSRFAANATAAQSAQTTANAAQATANAALPADLVLDGTTAPGTLATGAIYYQYNP
jgi:hypothetical protein